MREKLATLPLSQLRELAKSQGIKYVSGLRKSELVDRLCEVAENEKGDKTESAASGVQERTAGDARRGMTVRPVFMENARNPRGIQEAISRTWTAALRHTGSWR